MSLTATGTYEISPTCRNGIKGCLKNWLDNENSEGRKSYMHIGVESAYQHILNELSIIDGKFYKLFDQQNLKRNPTRKDWANFAISELIKVLNSLYSAESSNESLNYGPGGNIYSNANKQSDWITIHRHKPTVDKTGESYARYIWSAWTEERYRCPRFGRIIISNNINDTAKILLVYYIKNNVLYWGFPKGKPNIGESLNDGSIRETMEETGISGEDLCIYTGQDGIEIIKKCLYIGDIHKSQTRDYYYVITTTSIEFTTFKPQKHEIQGVVWFPINQIPCCDSCCVQPNIQFVNGQYKRISFHMVTLRDVDNKNPTILDILDFMDEKNGNQDATQSYLHAHRSCKHDLKR